MLCTAMAYVQRTADKIVLHVNNKECIHGTNNLIKEYDAKYIDTKKRGLFIERLIYLINY